MKRQSHFRLCECGSSLGLVVCVIQHGLVHVLYHSLCARVHSLCTRVHSLCARVHSLCARVRSLCTRVRSLCTRVRSLCTRVHSLCTRVHSLCTRVHSLCTQNSSAQIKLVLSLQFLARVNSTVPQRGLQHFAIDLTNDRPFSDLVNRSLKVDGLSCGSCLSNGIYPTVAAGLRGGHSV